MVTGYNAEVQRRYNQSPKGRERNHRAHNSPKGQEKRYRDNDSPKAKERKFRYHTSPKGLEVLCRASQRYRDHNRAEINRRRREQRAGHKNPL